MMNLVHIGVLVLSITTSTSNMPNISHFERIMNYQRFMQYHWFETVNSLLGVCNTQVAMGLKYGNRNILAFLERILTCCVVNSRIPTSNLCDKTKGNFKQITQPAKVLFGKWCYSDNLLVLFGGKCVIRMPRITHLDIFQDTA